MSRHHLDSVTEATPDEIVPRAFQAMALHNLAVTNQRAASVLARVGYHPRITSMIQALK